MRVPFTKYSGCGNDFILIDNRILNLSIFPVSIQKLCHRQQGIGADGVLFLEHSNAKNASHRMRIFNADGSEAEMCGNGLRCLAQHIRSIEDKQSSFFVETMHQIMKVSFHEDLVTISMDTPLKIEVISLALQSNLLTLHSLNTGVPHAVILADAKAADQLLSLAPAIRSHSIFPNGTNVNIASLLPDHSISVRTYERGVEQETLACGTGAVASALVAALAYDLPSPIAIRTRSKDTLHIGFQIKNTQFDHVTLTGPATKTFEGTIEYALFN